MNSPVRPEQEFISMLKRLFLFFLFFFFGGGGGEQQVLTKFPHMQLCHNLPVSRFQLKK